MASQMSIIVFCLLLVAFFVQPSQAQMCIVNSKECGAKQVCISNLCTTYSCKSASDCAGLTHDEAYGLKVGCVGGVCALQQAAKRSEGLDDATMVRLIKRIVTSGKRR